MQSVVGCLSADFDSDKGVLWSSLLRLTPSNQVWSWPAHRVLHHVCEKGRKHNADGKTKDCDVDFMYSWSKYQGPEDKYRKREDNGVSNIPYCVGVSSSIRVLPIGLSIQTETRSTSAWGYWIDMLSSENMRWKGSTINWI